MSLAQGGIRISVNGTEAPELAAAVVSAVIEMDLRGLERCRLVAQNWGPTGQSTGFLFFEPGRVDFGGTLRVALADGGGNERVFLGRVTALGGEYSPEAAPRLAVEAEDRLVELRLTSRTRAFAQVSEADLVRTIAQEHGLSADVSLPAALHDQVLQVNESDLAFLRARVERLDGALWLDGDVVHATGRDGASGVAVALTQGKNLREVHVSGNAAEQASEVAVTGWNSSSKEAIEAIAMENSIAGELDGLRSGPAVRVQAFGPRRERVFLAGSGGPPQAQAMAEAAFRRRARRFVAGRGVADGTAGLIPGRPVTLAGLGPWFDGRYAVTSTAHTFDAMRGYLTQFTFERPGIGPATRKRS